MGKAVGRKLTAILSLLAALCVDTSAIAQGPQSPTDPYLWLENAQSPEALAWVAKEDAKTDAALRSDPRFKASYDALLRLSSGSPGPPQPAPLAGGVVVYSATADHPRGALNWTSLADFQSPNPRWRTLIDIGALGAADGRPWLLRNIDCPPANRDRCLVGLSAGGGDALELREFDANANRFVEDGFRLPTSDQMAAFLDQNTLVVARDWGTGTTTAAGHPFIVKRLKRGQDLSTAVEIFRGAPSDASVWPYLLHDGQGHRMVVIQRARDTFHTETYQVTPEGVVRLAVPAQATLRGLIDNRLLFTLEQDWDFRGQAMKAGALVAVPVAWLIAPTIGPAKPTDPPMVVFQPGPRQSIEKAAALKDRIAVTLYDNVRGRLMIFHDAGRRGWASTLLAVPDNSSVDMWANPPGSAPNMDVWTTSTPDSDNFFYRVSGFLEPLTSWQADAATGGQRRLGAQAASFNGDNDVTEQFEARAPDGTLIPYFVIHPKAMRLDGSNPTILTAYGGYQFINAPYYDPVVGKLWLEGGGVFVVANIRGGGEFGPAWHDVAVKTHRQIVYDDFAAVARDLISRGISSPRRLGAKGGSNGAMVVGAGLVQHPELWNAVILEKPLLDLERYEHIAAGAGGVGEYGSMSKPEEASVLITTSPYANLKAGIRYPEALLLTNTLDDRAGPAHARKFAAKLAGLGNPYLFYEIGQGGHASSLGATPNQQAATLALEMTFLMQRLMSPPP